MNTPTIAQWVRAEGRWWVWLCASGKERGSWNWHGARFWSAERPTKLQAWCMFKFLGALWRPGTAPDYSPSDIEEK